MITIHEANATDFTTLGLGALTPTEAVIEEEAGGMYELTVSQPITDDYRHTQLTQYRILKAPAPTRETPLLTMENAATPAAAVTREVWKVDTGGVRLYLRTEPNWNAKAIHAYRDQTEVVVLEKTNSAWYRVAVVNGGASGYMSAVNLAFVRNETESIDGDTPPASVKVEQAREQLFRIYRIERDSAGRSVQVRAQHITYDLKGATVTGDYNPENEPAKQVVEQIMARADHDVSEFHIHCNITEPISGSYGGRNILDCLLDPDTGVIAQTGARMIRDNYNIYLLPDEIRQTGVEIRYGKNLLSANLTSDVSNVITRIRPAGKKKDGEPLYLEENNGYVDSPHISEYPVIYSKNIEYNVVESDELPLDQARDELKSMAEADFEKGVDLASLKLDAEFVRLELAHKYMDLANEYALHLYDSVPVIDSDADISVSSVRMTGYKWDALLERYTSTEMGELAQADVSVYGYEIANGSVAGTKIIPGSVGGDKLRDLSVGYAKINTAAVGQLSANAVTAVRADIRRLVAGEITTDQLYADLAKIALAQITTANIDQANIDWAQITNLSTEIANMVNASIGTADIDYARIKDMVTNTAIITEGVGGKLYIARLAVTEANMVSLSVGELMVKAADGSFKRITVDENGTVTAQTVTVEGDNVADATIPGGKLIENTITARELNVQQIFADRALIGAIKAANIDVANLFAAQATISELNSYLLKASTIEALKGALNIWASDKIDLAVGGIKVGGRNLLRYSKPLNLAHYIADSSGAAAMGTYQANEEGLRVVNANSNFRLWLGGKLAASGGQSFTVSFKYAMQSGSSPLQIQAVYYHSAEDTAPGYADSESTQKTIMVEGGWGWVQAAFEIPEYCHFVHFAFRSGRDYELYSCEYLVKEFKIEQGNVATDWSPAPEDMKVGGRNLLRNGGFYFGLAHWMRVEYQVNGDWRDIAIVGPGPDDYRANEVPNLVLHAQNESGMFGVAQTVTGLKKHTDYIIHGYAASHRCNTLSLEIKTPDSSGFIYSGMILENVTTGGTNLSAYDPFEYVFNTGNFSDLRITLFSNTFGQNGFLWLAQIKLEQGNRATDWSPSPEDEAKGLNTGESGVRVVITDQTFDVDVPDEYGDFHLGPDGARMHTMTAQSVSAPDVALRYSGARTFTVNANATSAQVAAGTHYRGLSEVADALRSREIPMGNLTINITSDLTEGTIHIAYLHGASVTINGNGHTLTGYLEFNGNSCQMWVNNLKMVSTNSSEGVRVINCMYTRFYQCVFNANNLAQQAFYMDRASFVFLYDCEFYNAKARLIHCAYSDLCCHALKGGNCANFLRTDNARVTWGGSRPDGAWEQGNPSLTNPTNLSGLTINSGTATPTVTAPVTGSWGLTSGDTYGNSWSFGSHDDLVQGWTSGGGRLKGCMWFDNGAIRTALSGKTVKSATLRLTMWKGVGRGVGVTVELCGTALNASGHTESEPAVTKSYGVIGTTQPGETATMTIPVQAVNDLKSGAINGLMLYSSDTEGYKGRVYSKNYARFDGATSGTSATKPVITVVYQ